MKSIKTENINCDKMVKNKKLEFIEIWKPNMKPKFPTYIVKLSNNMKHSIYFKNDVQNNTTIIKTNFIQNTSHLNKEQEIIDNNLIRNFYTKTKTNADLENWLQNYNNYKTQTCKICNKPINIKACFIIEKEKDITNYYHCDCFRGKEEEKRKGDLFAFIDYQTKEDIQFLFFKDKPLNIYISILY